MLNIKFPDRTHYLGISVVQAVFAVDNSTCLTWRENLIMLNKLIQAIIITFLLNLLAVLTSPVKIQTSESPHELTPTPMVSFLYRSPR
jgi:hypothetical protein